MFRVLLPRGCACVKTKGLADAFIKMRLPFESEEASKLNRDIFETIYFGAVNASVEVKPFTRENLKTYITRGRDVFFFFNRG